MKLIKLLYIADRKSLSEYHSSITTDSYYSMKYGPVVRCIYDCINHWSDLPPESVWKKAIALNKTDYTVSLINSASSFDMLSQEEKEILEEVNSGYKDESFHSFSEWKEPGSSCIPLFIEDILDAAIKDGKEKECALENLDFSSCLQYISFKNRG